MVKNLRIRAAWLALCCFLAFAGQALAQDRPAEQILAEIKAVEMPARPKNSDDQPAFQAYLVAQRAATQKKSVLIGELFRANPETPELDYLLPARWQAIRSSAASLSKIKPEVNAVIARNQDEKLVGEAYYYQALIAIQSEKTKVALANFETFAQKYPKDHRLPTLLFVLAKRTTDPDVQEAFFQRIETDYPKSTSAKQLVGARVRAKADRLRFAQVGKTLDLEFTDAIRGSQISMASLKGKVVVVDFWATWCGPCVAEMPHMKKLYAEFKDKGVEFIGVSLDAPRNEGGYDALKAFVEKNQIEWPQYYKDDGSVSDFATTWGVNAIPTIFVIDVDGTIASLDAGGKLEGLLPDLLEKAEKPKHPEAKP